VIKLHFQRNILVLKSFQVRALQITSVAINEILKPIEIILRLRTVYNARVLHVRDASAVSGLRDARSLTFVDYFVSRLPNLFPDFRELSKVSFDYSLSLYLRLCTLEIIPS